jgi:hypothetical protein
MWLAMCRAESLVPEYQVRKARFLYIALFLILLVGWSAVLLGECSAHQLFNLAGSLIHSGPS